MSVCLATKGIIAELKEISFYGMQLEGQVINIIQLTGYIQCV